MKSVEKGIAAILLIFQMILISCTGGQSENPSVEKVSTITANTDLVIGAEDQPPMNQLGRPEAVRVDEEGDIYVADRASMEIKVFGRDGNYIKSLGGRGRGPGEFQDIELMEWTPEGHLVVMDRGNMQYMVISTEGEQIDAFPYNMSDQFYPRSVRYVDGQMLALFHNSSSFLEIPRLERHLFHIYSTDFQQRKTSFMPVKELGVEEGFSVAIMSFHLGSFTLIEENDAFIFSPSTYTGNFFVFHKHGDGNWKYEKVLQGTKPQMEPIRIYHSEQQYQRALEEGVARAKSGWGGGKQILGSQLSVDAGLFSLDDGRIVQFYAEWKEGYERLPGSESHPMDLYVQVFGTEGELQQQSYLFTYTEKYAVPNYAVVNWMDEGENFYLFDYPGDVPTVRRFSLELQD